MVTEHQGPEQEADEDDPREERLSSQGSSRFSRDGVDSSISDWLASKEKKRSEGAGKIQPGRGRLNRTKLNPVSKKGKQRQQEYKKAREEHYSNEANQKCFLCGSTSNLSIHHIRGRGKYTSDTSTYRTLCLVGSYMDEAWPELNSSGGTGCHGFIHANPSWAREHGLLE